MGLAGGRGATVIQLGGGTRELYYYPKDTMTVINVGENVNKGKSLVQYLPSLSIAAPTVVLQLPQGAEYEAFEVHVVTHVDHSAPCLLTCVVRSLAVLWS